MPEGPDTDARLDDAYARIAAHEQTLVAPLLAFLDEHPACSVLGPVSPAAGTRVPTVSFVVDGARASEVPPRLDERQVAVRWGHFYAYRAARDLGLLEPDGVVRASMVHTNTPREVERLIEGLEAAFEL